MHYLVRYDLPLRHECRILCKSVAEVADLKERLARALAVNIRVETLEREV